MKFIRRLLPEIYKKHKDEQWDTVWAVVADEGTGKSFFSMTLLEEWLKISKGSIVPNDIKHMCLDYKEFVTDLKDLIKCEITVWDEAGDLTNRRALSQLNVRITQAYKVIRGDNLFTILVLPSLWDLDPFFTKRRLRGLIHVYKRQRFNFWSRDRLRKMVALNADRYIKNYYVVKPTHKFGWIPKYKGVLLEPYMKKKEEHMNKIRAELYASLIENDKKSTEKDIAEYAIKNTPKEAAKKFGCSVTTVYNKLKVYTRRQHFLEKNNINSTGEES